MDVCSGGEVPERHFGSQRCYGGASRSAAMPTGSVQLFKQLPSVCLGL